MTTDLAQIMKDAARLAAEAADAAARGDMDAAMSLQSQAEQAMQRAKRLSQRKGIAPTLGKTLSVRERAIAALTELNVPCAPKDIAAYSEARQGEAFDVRALASIRRDEYRSWASGSKRNTFLVPALEGPWFVAGRGRFALSHWPLWQRIIGPLTARADHLRVCVMLTGLIESQPADAKGQPDRGKRLGVLLAQYARSVPGALEDAWARVHELNLERVRSAAHAELALIQDEDERARQREAERASRNLNEEQLIWGGPIPQVVGGNSA